MSRIGGSSVRHSEATSASKRTGSHRGGYRFKFFALPNSPVYGIKAAPAAPLARRLRRALPLGGPPVARRATCAGKQIKGAHTARRPDARPPPPSPLPVSPPPPPPPH